MINDAEKKRAAAVMRENMGFTPIFGNVLSGTVSYFPGYKHELLERKKQDSLSMGMKRLFNEYELSARETL